MSLRLNNYKLGYKVVSLALDEPAREKLFSENLNILYVDQKSNRLIFLPENIALSQEQSNIEKIETYNNFDVLEIWDNGVLFRKYNNKSDDNYFFVTGKCNSNCIMCPSPEQLRKMSNDVPIDTLMELARHIPSDTPHMTITGGEPFLIGDSIFPFLEYLKEKFTETEFLFLTNGRIFALNKYFEEFCDSIPNNSIVAIPVHGSCDKVHDSITRADGSFKQTKIGIKRLLSRKIPVEIRLVISKMNIYDFNNIAKLVIEEFKGIEYVSIIAMEMTGTARTNIEKVWIPYSEASSFIENSIRELIENGIDVKLYNFPLCTVSKPFWTLCEKSISENKVRFTENCDNCKYKESCSGVFSGTLSLEKDELKAIL